VRIEEEPVRLKARETMLQNHKAKYVKGEAKQPANRPPSPPPPRPN
jgi:hypothetical protein